MTDQRRMIALATDFGSADGMVGAMIGVIKSICPDAEVISVTSAIPAHDVVRGGPILVDTGREILIGPDNGVLSWAWWAQPDVRFHVLSNEACRLSQARVTFDGRDLFAPAATHLAYGVDPALFGPTIDQPFVLDWPEPVQTEGRIEGRVLVEGTFGNLITNIPFEDVPMESTEAVLGIESNGRDAGELCGSYEAIAGATGVVVNGTGLLENAAPRGSAADSTGTGCGARVVAMKRREKP